MVFIWKKGKIYVAYFESAYGLYLLATCVHTIEPYKLETPTNSQNLHLVGLF